MTAAGAMHLSPDDLTRQATRHVFLTGKGGVGKTSHACALAVGLARAGRSVLLVSTDPASNLSDVLGSPVGPTRAEVRGIPGLSAMNIDPHEAVVRYRAATLDPLRSHLAPAELRKAEEQLSGACTTEIASFDAFTALLATPESSGGVDHIIFDTAPTGHTLRLLQLPEAWTGYLERSPAGASCLGPAAGQGPQQRQFQGALDALRDPEMTTIYLVVHPDSGSVAEAERTAGELAGLGISNQRLIVNGVFRGAEPSDPLATALELEGTEALENLPPRLAGLPRLEVQLRARNVLGLEALEALHAPGAPEVSESPPEEFELELPELPGLLDELSGANTGLVLVVGKGGVGKTSLAAAIAVGLADRGHQVQLATTDPAAHLDAALPGGSDGIRVSRIDPGAENQAYQERVLMARGPRLDEEGRAALAGELESPCTEEVAVFQAFSRLVNDARRGWVVLDTAPTGHTLLLMDTTGAYHREATKGAGKGGGRITTPLMRLQEGSMTHVIITTLAETTPVEEARALQEELRQAGIEPWAWVVNRSLAAARPTDALLARRAANEIPHIRRIRKDLAGRMAVVPRLPRAPVGSAALRALGSETPALAGTDPSV